MAYCKVFPAVLAAVALFNRAQAAPSGLPTWTFADQASWPGECKTGTEQTPINIVTDATKAADVALTLSGYKAPLSNWTVSNNGHTAQLTVPADKQGEYTVSGGALSEPYKLWQFHMHWGSKEKSNQGAEHLINSKRHAMELHFVHYKGKYANPAGAIASGDRDALSVVGVIFDLDDTADANAALTQFLKTASKRAEWAGESKAIKKGIDMSALLPATFVTGDSRRSAYDNEEYILNNFRDVQPLNGRTVTWSKTKAGQSYFMYKGGLTTPGCNEIVSWNVIDPVAHRMTITSKQLDILYSLHAVPKPSYDRDSTVNAPLN